MMLLRNIARLLAVPPGPVRGPAMDAVRVVEDAAIVVEGGGIAWFGRAADAPKGPSDETIDAGGGIVVPGLIDCHTHAVFAGNRAAEFVERIRGRSYLEIMQAGGGIRSTMRAVRGASEKNLVRESLPRLRRMLSAGVTTVEIKSGYGLSVDDELKMLRAIRQLAGQTQQEIVPTYLAAHAVPPEFDGRTDEYIDTVSADDALRQLAGDGLAKFADAFCEKGAFTVDQCQRYLQRCAAHGLRPKLHADQITRTGATQLAIEQGAASADHLECVEDADIAALKRTETIPVLLPGCSFFLNTEPAPARKLIDAGLPVALATDCNPGSCMIESLPLIMSIACCLLRMTPTEALVACTANAAAALGRADRLGAIAVGHQADLLVLDIGDVAEWPYRVAVNPVRTILKAGRVITNDELRVASSE